MGVVVEQLVQLWMPHYTEVGKHGQDLVAVRLGMFLADTPRRNDMQHEKIYRRSFLLSMYDEKFNGNRS